MSNEVTLYLNGEPITCTTSHTFDPGAAPDCRATNPQEREVTLRLAPVYTGRWTAPMIQKTPRIGRQRKAKKLLNWSFRAGLHTPKQVKLSLRYLKWILTTHKQTHRL